MLNDAQLQELEQHAIALARGAGHILLEHFQKPLEVEYKSKDKEHDPVTEADRRAETYLKEEIERHLPGHGIVGEEGAGEGTEVTEFTWVIDPLDGTTNFLNGLPAFASSIGLLHQGVPAVAAVYLPWPTAQAGRVLHARRGGGSREGEQVLQVTRVGASHTGPAGQRAWWAGGWIPPGTPAPEAPGRATRRRQPGVRAGARGHRSIHVRHLWGAARLGRGRRNPAGAGGRRVCAHSCAWSAGMAALHDLHHPRQYGPSRAKGAAQLACPAHRRRRPPCPVCR